MAARPRTARRRWSETFKKRVVAEASEPGVRGVELDKEVQFWRCAGTGGGYIGR